MLEQMLILFLVMLTGWIARKRGIMDSHGEKILSALVVNVANPAMILSGVMGENGVTREQFFYTMGISIGMYVVLVILAAFLPKLLRISDKGQGNLYQMMLIFSNIGFMGFPIISAAYGSGALVYAMLFLLPYNVLVYTYGISLMKSGEEKEPGGWKKSLGKMANVGVIACILAVGIYLSGITVPAVLADTLNMLGGLTAPLSMLVIGASFYQMDFKALFTDWRLLVFSVLKLLVIPVAGIFVMGQFISDPVLLGVCMVMLATPVGSMNSMLAMEYGGDTALPAKGIAITTLLSVVTIPFVSYLCGFF